MYLKPIKVTEKHADSGYFTFSDHTVKAVHDRIVFGFIVYEEGTDIMDGDIYVGDDLWYALGEAQKSGPRYSPDGNVYFIAPR